MEANEGGNRSRAEANGILIFNLAAGKTQQNAAEAAGVSESTVIRRMADPEFRRRVQAVRDDMLKQALGRITSSLAEAADTLRVLLTAESESIRLGAARALIDSAVKLREAASFEERLAALEEASKPREGEP